MAFNELKGFAEMAHLTEAQVAEFEAQGYLVVRGLFDPEEDLDPVIEEYAGVLDRLVCELYENGDISSTYDDLPFGDRLTKIYAESGKVHAQYFDFSLPQKNVQADTPMWVGPAVFHLLRNEKLLDAVESLIGPEIYSNPVQHVRLKPPEHLCPVNDAGRVQLGATPWHQDTGVVRPEADETNMLTVWFGPWDATIENGCLEVIPRSHREGLLHHCHATATMSRGFGLQIPDRLLRQGDGVVLPMKRGDVLFFHRLNCHSSLPNKSDNIRWSFDLRYNPIGQPTGRGSFPGFVARSRSNPESELHDPEEWARLWHEARRRLARSADPTYNRWKVDDPVCA